MALGTGCRERPTPEPAACSKMCFEIYSKKLLESASHRETGPRKRVQPSFSMESHGHGCILQEAEGKCSRTVLTAVHL